MKNNRSILNSPKLNELKRKRKRNLKKKIIFLLLGMAIIISGLTYISRLPKLNIGDITVTGNKIIDADSIKEVVQNDLSGYYFWLFPKTNFLLFPKHKIEDDLSDQFKRAKDITANINGTSKLDIALSERVATYTWCGDMPSADVEKCFFMDDTGYVLDDAPYFSGSLYFKFYGKIANDSDSPLGLYYMQDNFKKLLNLKDILLGMGLNITSLYVKDDNDAEFYLSSKIAPPDSPKIMFNIDSDFNQLAENLQTALTTEPLQTDFNTKFSSLLYIDLRFGNKIYYKFK